MRVGRPSRGGRLIAGVFAGILWASTASGQTSELLGRPVVSVAYTCDGPVDASELARLVEIRVGRPLTEADTGGTIRNLFQTGRYSDVQIEAVPQDGVVAVTLHLFRSFRVLPLRFKGAPIARDELRRAVGFSEGAVFHPGDLEEGAAALKRRLEQEGYLAARISPEVSYNRATFDAEVVYRIAAGKPARVARAFFDGNMAPFTADELLRHARLDPGDRYRESRARADATRMTEFLHKNGRLKGSVELIAAQPTDDGRIMPVYRISVGPRVVFEGHGIKAKKVEKEVHAAIEGQQFDEDQILQYVENKRKDLQRSGYYRAKVDYAISESPDTTAVRITVDPGTDFGVEKIAFAGNRSVPAKQLLALMVTRRRGLPLIRPGHLVDDDLNDDVSAVLGFYQSHGWVSARVGPAQVTEGSKPNRLVVTIPVEEGPRTIVESRQLVGAEHAVAELEKNLRVRAGEPFNPNELRQDVSTILSFYRDRGWREAAARDEFTFSPDKTSVRIVYRVEEGLRSFVGKTIIRGNARTDVGRIQHLVTWKEGRPFSESELLETQRNLARAGVFRRVEIRPEPPDPATQVRNIEVNLQESRPLAVLYGFGYQYAENADQNRSDPFGVAGVTYNNLFGKMLSAGVEGQVSISGRFRLQLTYRDPFLFNRDLRFTGLFFATREPIQNVDIERVALVNEVSKYFGRYLRVALRLEYQRIRPVNPQSLSDIERLNFPRFDQPINEMTAGPNFLYDRRDDVIDPHHGYYFTGGVKYAFPALTAEARYTKTSGQAVYFRPVGASVLGFSVRAGAIFPYGPSDIQVPIAERFFAGGPSTDRGFQTDLLGIPGQTVDYNTRATLHQGSGAGSCASSYPELADRDCDSGPRIVGGNAFLAFNVEVRFPIAGNIGGTVFYDAAQVWKNFSDVRLRLEGTDGLRESVGIGLHYMLPIGPVRLGLGFPLRPLTIPFDVTKIEDQKVVVLIPHAGSTRERIRFFFSLGYPF